MHGQLNAQMGMAQKTGAKNGTLVIGNMDQKLRNPGSLILSHCQIPKRGGKHFKILSRSPSSALSHPFFGFWVPLLTWTTRKKTRVPTDSSLSNLEDLVVHMEG